METEEIIPDDDVPFQGWRQVNRTPYSLLSESGQCGKLAIQEIFTKH